MSRILAIGDIHGESTALDAILDWIAPQPDDVIVTLGDYVDRGPDSRGVIERLLKLEQQTRLVPILGNHEEMMLEARVEPASRDAWIMVGGHATLRSYLMFGMNELERAIAEGSLDPASTNRPRTEPPENYRELEAIADEAQFALDSIPAAHWEFLGRCVDYYETETHLFFHGGYDAHLPRMAQTRLALRWRSLCDYVPPPHHSGKQVIVGHTSQKNGEVLDVRTDNPGRGQDVRGEDSVGRVYLRCIDTYCYGGGWLTALDVGSGQLYQVDADGNRRA